MDGSRKTVTVRQGKGRKDRIVPIGNRALRWIAHYVQAVRPQLLVNPDIRALFVALDGIAGLTANGITHTVGHYIRTSGIAPWGSCHLFRHAMATQMLENGADIRWIQAMLGHASIESTQLYTQVSIKALSAVHASTHPAERDTEEETGLLADLTVDEGPDDTPCCRIARKSSSLSSWPQDGAGQTLRRPWRTACLVQVRRSGVKCRPASANLGRSLQHSLLACRHST